METNSGKPGDTPSDGERLAGSPSAEQALDAPVVAYTANGNLEAHSVVIWLESNGVRAHAVEDNSAPSIFAFGTISQFHKPQVFVDKPDLERAGELCRQFESRRAERRGKEDGAPILSECEECGESSKFPASQKGTVQNCPKCDAFMDIGPIDWPEDFDFGEAESPPDAPDTAEDAMDAAVKLDKAGDWDEAILAYQAVADRWPEHSTYVANCIAEVRRKLEATQ